MNILKGIFATLFLFILSSLPCSAYNIRHLSKMWSLSNNSIESLYQDQTGRLWIGTCDGVNIFDGRKIEIYQPKDRNKALLGNIIDDVIETDSNVMWIQTYYGLNKLNRNTNTVSHYADFNPKLYMTKDKQNTLFVLQEDNLIHYYDTKKDTFNVTMLSGISLHNVLHVSIDKDNKLWLICKDGNFISYNIIYKGEEIFFVENFRVKRFNALTYAFCSSNDILCVDDEQKLYGFNLHKLSQTYLFDLSNLIEKKGEISAMLRSGENIYIGYKTNGVQILKKVGASYQIENIAINCGIFSLWKDRYQDIVWIGTDGQGVYSYSNDIYSIKTLNIKDYIPHIGKPIRSIFKDSHQTLWIGTKGDGIIRINNFDESQDLSTAKIDHLTTNNSALKDDAVYCIRKSQEKILWIGTEKGLNYYSYADKTIRSVDLTVKGKPVMYIHDVYEKDSFLWISTVGMGVVKAQLKWRGNQPVLQSVDELVMDGGKMPANYFFRIYPFSDSVLWIANRGLGAFKLNINNMGYEQITFGKSNRKTLDEVLSINSVQNNMYFGTSAGLIEYADADNYTIYDNNDGFLNNTIHDILKEDNNSLWLSTNRGLINYRPNDQTARSYNSDNGLGIAEYSDGAAFHDSSSGVLYFGGVDGLVSITRHRDYSSYEYMPNLTFEHLTILGEDKNIKDYIKNGAIELKHTENFITIEVNAIDYINTHNYAFYYKINEVSDQWIDNGSSTVIPITNLNYGKYTLSVKYVNKSIDSSSAPEILIIRVLPPWYLSFWAYGVYIILLLTSLFLLYKYLAYVREKKRKSFLRKLEAKHKEEIHESKLVFFTSIAHEFCTPLTLIHGPCSQILEQAPINSKTKQYADVILRNTERLNSLVQDLIGFRKIESSSSLPNIEELNITEILNDTVLSFKEFASSHEAKFYKLLPHDLKWNSNKNYIITIVTNLLSNAFKYMSPQGIVEIEAKIKDETQMVISISNTGQGIKEEKIEKIFDRHTIFNASNDFSSKTWSRHGLGLAIVHAMVTNLGGAIKVKSTLNEWTHFIVTLPYIQCQKTFIDCESSITLPQMTMEQELPKLRSIDQNKPIIMAIDDEIDILWLYTDIFSEEYNVITISDPTKVAERLAEFHPEIILCDLNMPHLNGKELIHSIKTDKNTSHIPLIIVSAKHDVDEQVEGVDAGAELFITKPFHVDYLKASVKSLINRKKSLKEYFSSSISAYVLNEGLITHQEDSKVLQEIKQIIIENITNKKLNVMFIAESMNLSTRSLYRKLANTNHSSISDLIRDSRLHIAENLLLQTKKTIAEIIEESGFNNRASFYKAFTLKHNCSPTEYRGAKTSEL